MCPDLGITRPGPIPASAGIGLRAAHHEQFLADRPAIGWIEIHSENFFAEGGPQLALLEAVRADYPLSCHGVGLSLGSTDPLDREHLRQLRRLVDRFEPGFVSEHCSYASAGGRFVNDLLPLPYTEEALAHMIARVTQVQHELGRRILIENPSSYLAFSHAALGSAQLSETQFLTELARATDCGLLLDVNNVYVSAHNLGFDAVDYLRALPGECIDELHLAGFTSVPTAAGTLLIDTHSAPVQTPVWALYAQALELYGPKPALIEWDLELPDLSVLVSEARRADTMRLAGVPNALVA